MINQPMAVKSGSAGGGLHYTKVKSVVSEGNYRVYPQFIYQKRDGEYVVVNDSKELPETECRENSVLVTGTKYSSGEVWPVGQYKVIRLTVENDTLTLTGEIITLGVAGAVD